MWIALFFEYENSGEGTSSQKKGWNQMSKVVKFGGSSLAEGSCFQMVKSIVEADKNRDVVVVSAPGKRFSGDNKITDLLYICHAHIKYHASYEDIWQKIEDRYREIKEFCHLTLDLDSEFAEIKAKFDAGANVDYIVSRGEYLNAKLMAEYLGYTFVDSASWLFFGYDGKVDFETSYAALASIFSHHPKIVLPGFYGSLPNGAIKTFTRGGSDVTGAIAAAAIEAESYENWTDVSGMLMADPRIVKNPKPIRQITFAELRELSYMGAEVLHEETVFPVRQKKIPLYIKNTKDIYAQGTLILEEIEKEDEEEKDRFITGITGKKHFTIITISKNRMNDDPTFLRRALQQTENYGLTVEHIPSSIDKFSFVIASKPLESCLHNLLADIKIACDPDSVTITGDISLIAVIGRRMAWKPGVSGRLFGALGQHDINIRMIEQGADEINIMVGVEDKDFEKAIRIFYESFT